MEMYPIPLFPRLAVRDLSASVRWYREALGFTTVFELPGENGELRMAHIRREKYQDLMLLPDGAGDVGGKGVTLGFMLPAGESVDRLAERARAAGANIEQPPTDQPWNVRELIVRDPDGYRLSFGERIDENLSFAAVRQRMGGPNPAAEQQNPIQEQELSEMSTSTVNITATQVRELRDKCGAPMMDCKQALIEAKGDMEQAMVLLRKKGIATAAKKAARVTSEGSVASYIHAGGKIGVLVEVNCESDFVARTEDFKELVHDIAMHIAASDPKFIRKEDVTPEAYEKEKDIYRAQAKATGKPDNVVEKIVEGKMAKFYEEVCLYEQPFIKDQAITVSQLIASKIGKLGENISVRRFARFKVGDANWTIAQTKASDSAQ